MKQIFTQSALAAALALTAFAGQAMADTAPAAPLMSPQWAAQACTAWNDTPQLTSGLAGKWIANDKKRGYKIIHIYRKDCKDSPQVELKIVPKDGKAMCAYGGKVMTSPLDSSVDYLMWAETDDWHDMGAGKYGPMHAMMFGDLLFEGPKWEAMSVMGPFGQFLLLVGKVPSTDACPAK